MVWFDVIASYYRPLFQYRMNTYNHGRRGLKRGSGERRRKREKRSSGRSWTGSFSIDIQYAHFSTRIMWILIYALQDIVRELDIRLFLHERNGYRTAGMNPVLVALWLTSVFSTPRPTALSTTGCILAGSWNDILWPAYLKAHAKMFHNNDVASNMENL